MVQATEHLGVLARVDRRQIEEGDRVAVAHVEEEVRRSGQIAVLEHVHQREAQQILVERDGPLHVR